MPCYEFDEQIRRESSLPVNPAIERFMYDELSGANTNTCNYWGYTSGYYYAPKASYCATKDPVKEYKDMIKALHDNDIEILMEFYFDSKTNPYLIFDCIRYWVQEYHIDGVHLIGAGPLAYILSQDPMLRETKILTAPSYCECGHQSKVVFHNLGIYEDSFQTTMRKFLKSDENQIQDFLYQINRNTKNAAVISYITEQNGFTLMDLVSYDSKHNEANGEDNLDGTDFNYSWNCGVEGNTKRKQVVLLRKKQIKNALCFLFLNQGIPMLLSGDEMGKSKQGNNNTYCQDNELSYLKWHQILSNQDILHFVKHLISFRKEHPILHNPEELCGADYLGCGYPDVSYHSEMAWYPNIKSYSRHIGVMYYNKYADTKEKNEDFIYIAYNMHWEEREFALPKLPNSYKWYQIIDTNEKISFIEESDRKPLLTEQKNLLVSGRSVVVLLGKK